jgi:putative transposase
LRPIRLFFMVELGSHPVVYFGLTRSPTDTWVAQQLREATPDDQRPGFLIRDNNRKYGTSFEQVAAGSGIEVLHTPFRAPRANAVCERFLPGVRQECLDRLLFLGERQLYRVVRIYLSYFNEARPQQGIEQRIPAVPNSSPEGSRRGKIVAFPVLA